jgi:hypothetical protein
MLMLIIKSQPSSQQLRNHQSSYHNDSTSKYLRKINQLRRWEEGKARQSRKKGKGSEERTSPACSRPIPPSPVNPFAARRDTRTETMAAARVENARSEQMCGEFLSYFSLLTHSAAVTNH